MAIIKEDCYGIYVKINGSLYRPNQSVMDNPDQLITGRIINSAFIKNDRVAIRLMKSAPYCKIVKGDYNEIWVSHGSYFDHTKTIPSIRCWRPVNQEIPELI